MSTKRGSWVGAMARYEMPNMTELDLDEVEVGDEVLLYTGETGRGEGDYASQAYIVDIRPTEDGGREFELEFTDDGTRTVIHEDDLGGTQKLMQED